MTVRKILTIGNSLAVGIPREVARGWGLKSGDEVFVKREGGVLLVSKTPPPLDALISRLSPHLGRDILAVVAYGSFVKGGYRPGESDIDLLYVVRDPSSRDPIYDATSGLEAEADYEYVFSNLVLTPLQVKGLLDAGDPFIREALRGLCLYGRDAVRHLLE